MSVALSRRMGLVAWLGRATDEERAQLAQGLAHADSLDDLPPETQNLMRRLEAGVTATRPSAAARSEGAMFEALRAAAVELDDEEAERDLADVLAGCTPDELDELSALAEMDGDE